MRITLRYVTFGLLCGFIAWPTGAGSLAEDQPTSKPAIPDDAEMRNIEAANKITRAEAGKYEFSVRDVEQPAVLREQPILRWSNPERGQICGNVLLWTDRGRPVAVGSLFKWFAPFTHMSHEFHSLTSGEISGKYELQDVWRSKQPGVVFAPVPAAPAVAATPAGRLTQMKQLARQFTARSVDREGLKLELRQLTQPACRYELDKDSAEVSDGALFVFVQGTDPDVWLMLEARKTADRSPPQWHHAVARMNSIELTVEYRGQRIWHCDPMPHKEVFSHKAAYTSFRFDPM